MRRDLACIGRLYITCSSTPEWFGSLSMQCYFCNNVEASLLQSLAVRTIA